MRSLKIQSSKLNVCGTPHPTLRNFKGFTNIALLAAIVIIGTSLGSTTKYRYNISLLDKEEELIFRGQPVPLCDRTLLIFHPHQDAVPSEHG